MKGSTAEPVNTKSEFGETEAMRLESVPSVSSFH